MGKIKKRVAKVLEIWRPKDYFGYFEISKN
jgi:hypothetical protein